MPYSFTFFFHLIATKTVRQSSFSSSSSFMCLSCFLHLSYKESNFFPCRHLGYLVLSVQIKIIVEDLLQN